VALAALADIARNRQVLLFTHHLRIVEQARAAGTVVHEIGGE
jgi:hypothetical protein